MATKKPGKKKNRQIWLAGFFGTQKSRPKKQVQESNEPKPVAAHVFSGRFLFVLGVFIVMAFAAYAPLSAFLKQQAEIKEVKANIASLQAEQEDLQTQLSWWQDDNYVKQQAKDRLFYVTAGETPYLVVGQDYTSNLADDTSAAAKTAPQESWTNNLWNSFQESAIEGYESPQPSASASATSSTDSPVAGASDSASQSSSSFSPANQ